MCCDILTACVSVLLQNIPTLGTVAITMALHNCDEVAVAGFGYDMNTPHAPLHYYETVKMSAIKEVRFCSTFFQFVFFCDCIKKYTYFLYSYNLDTLYVINMLLND